MTTNASGDSSGGAKAVRRLWPVAVLLVVVVALVVFGPGNEAILEALRENRGAVVAYVADNAVAAGLVYVGVYALAIAFSIPGGAMMTIVGGFLFGPVKATVYVAFAATAGATALFLVARGAVGDRLRSRAGPWMQRMEAGFRKNALNYLLFLRLVPIFPFFVVNLVPAFLGVSARTYVIATFFGIIPGTFVFSLFGDGLGQVLDAGDDLDVATVLSPEIIAALVGLAALALTPVVYKKLRAGKS
jgi:uncharacterized membrane protein YdjX (TVP38/TMEM64 family)